MTDCINCKCTPTTDCAELQHQNDEKLREFATHYKYLQTCQLAEEGAKGFYNVWCMLKSVIGTVCELKSKFRTLKAGDNVTLNDDGTNITISSKDTTYKAGTGITLSGNTFSADTNVLATKTSVDALANRLATQESKVDKDTKYTAGEGLRLSGDNTFSVVGFVSEDEYNRTKNALEALLRNLKDSGAWVQTGRSITDGNLAPNRNIATGNINIFGGTQDGNSFIRTNSGQTENDLAGGI